MKWVISVAVLAVVAVWGANADRPTTARPPCEPNASWKEGCNDCICDANQRAVCTDRACPTPTESQTGQQVEVPRPLPDLDRPTGAMCLEGHTWRQDCNRCSCQSGRAICTTRACPPRDDTTTESGRCVPGSTWKMNCNTCSCLGGRAACTQMACIGSGATTLPERTEPELSLRPKMDDMGRCKTAAVWKENCNTCRCDKHFYPMCTLIGCSSQSEASALEVQETQRRKRQSCSAGQVWKDDCNTCRCTASGPACTKMRCIKPSDLVQAEAETQQQQREA